MLCSTLHHLYFVCLPREYIIDLLHNVQLYRHDRPNKIGKASFESDVRVEAAIIHPSSGVHCEALLVTHAFESAAQQDDVSAHTKKFESVQAALSSQDTMLSKYRFMEQQMLAQRQVCPPAHAQQHPC